jgi:hypothetical protein
VQSIREYAFAISSRYQNQEAGMVKKAKAKAKKKSMKAKKPMKKAAKK